MRYLSGPVACTCPAICEQIEVLVGPQQLEVYTEFLQHKPVTADSHIACRAHAAPMPCRAAKGLECVIPISFTQCGRV